MLKLAAFILLLVASGVICHQGHHHDSSHLVYVDHLLDKYSNAAADPKLTYSNVVNYVDNYLDLIASLKSESSHDFECLQDSLTEFKVKLSRENRTERDGDATIGASQFLKLNTFLVANLDRCYLNNQTFRTFDKHSSTIRNESDSSKKSLFASALNIPKSTYFYAFLAIIVISLIGVLCVAVVPALNKCCFDYIFQFLTALALGTLCSDALLHLIPHTFVKHGHSESFMSEFDLILMSKHDHRHQDESSHENEHNSAILKGLAVLVGIYIFFLIETLLQICKSDSTKKSRKYSKEERNESVDSYDETDELIINNTTTTVNTSEVGGGGGRKLSDFSFYDNLDSRQNINMKQLGPKLNSNVILNKSVKKQAVERQKKPLTPVKELIHSHSHSSETKTSLWMVIFGDCLHNLSDGLAIGASFTTSLTTGFGTTMAIFFHELPHEIGDFAVLRKNGVSTRNAILFNLLSSVLSLLGCFIGLVIGSVETLSNWSFLIIAGTFIYISLVDLIPELHEFYKLNKPRKFLVFGLQNLGILLGIGLMLSIAFYEQEIIKLIKRLNI